jgi:aldose 1-epimerase
MDELTLIAADATLTISPGNGGRLASLRIGTLDVIGADSPAPVDWGCFAMVPYAGRIRNGLLRWRGQEHQLEIDMPPNAIHGVGYDRPWTVLAAGAREATLRRDFDERWPWTGYAVQTVRLEAGGLTARLEVHATGTAMPAWIGFHPWFSRRLAVGRPARLELRAAGVLPRDDEGMPGPTPVPVPAGPWDDVFTGISWPAAVVWDGALRLEITSDHPWGVVFTQRESAVCVEPQTGPPNAAELGLAATVQPGAPLTLTMAWAWSRL